MAPAALAQHVVTDDEAGKLTFDALTATPRPVFRHVIYYRTARASWADMRSVSAVHAASYRHSVHNAGALGHYGIVRRRRRG